MFSIADLDLPALHQRPVHALPGPLGVRGRLERHEAEALDGSNDKHMLITTKWWLGGFGLDVK